MTQVDEGPDWYDRRNELEPDMIFRTHDGFVMLDRRKPGDGTQWIVADWHEGWSHYDSTIEPGDLIGEPIASEDALRALIAAERQCA